MGVTAIVIGVIGILVLSAALNRISEQLKEIVRHLEMIRERIVKDFPP